MNDNEGKEGGGAKAPQIIARAYYDPALHREKPASAYAYGLGRNFTAHTRIINLIQTGKEARPDFEALYPDAAFKGWIMDDNVLRVPLSEKSFMSLPSIGPAMPLEDLQDGPAPRVIAQEPKVPERKFRIVSSNDEPGQQGPG